VRAGCHGQRPTGVGRAGLKRGRFKFVPLLRGRTADSLRSLAVAPGNSGGRGGPHTAGESTGRASGGPNSGGGGPGAMYTASAQP
jgi:hypothetical protein